jgi:hypothetical protein
MFVNIGAEPFDSVPVQVSTGANEFAAFCLFENEIQSKMFEARNWIGVRGYLGPGWKSDQVNIKEEQTEDHEFFISCANPSFCPS